MLLLMQNLASTKKQTQTNDQWLADKLPEELLFVLAIYGQSVNWTVLGL